MSLTSICNITCEADESHHASVEHWHLQFRCPPTLEHFPPFTSQFRDIHTPQSLIRPCIAGAWTNSLDVQSRHPIPLSTFLVQCKDAVLAETKGGV